MKFLLAVLAIRFLVNALSSNRNDNGENEVNSNNDARHPAEFGLR
jgi:hypothetical protein